MKKKFQKWRAFGIDANLLLILLFIIISIIGISLSAPSFEDDASKFESITKVDSYSYTEDTKASVSVVERYKYVTLGEFKLTVYTPYCDEGKWGYQTATGVTSQHLITCAVDPKVIPYGTEIIIREGNNELRLKAVDCGGSVKGNHIDIFYDDTIDVAIEWLMETFGYYAEVYIEEEII